MKPLSPEEIRSRIETKAQELGFDTMGVAEPKLSQRDRERLAEFVAEGQHGTMDWMARHLDRRGDPKTLWPEVRSVIVLGTNYGPDHNPMENLADRDAANISVYARNLDYHDVIKKRLKQLGRWMAAEFDCALKVFVDTAPVLEKPLAERAGIGWQGKHTCLVSRDFGSWLFLSEIFTTLPLPTDDAGRDHCGTCTRCQDICPTKAFPKPYTLDARRCLSYLTIEHKGPIPREFRKAMGNRVYGCDDCLAICPWNRFAQASREQAFLPREALTAPRLRSFLDMDDPTFRAHFRKSPIKRSGRERFLRNVLVALGNSGDTDATGDILPLLDDPSPVLRASAVWALRQLMDEASFATLRHGRPAETEEMVREEWNAQ